MSGWAESRKRAMALDHCVWETAFERSSTACAPASVSSQRLPFKKAASTPAAETPRPWLATRHRTLWSITWVPCRFMSCKVILSESMSGPTVPCHAHAAQGPNWVALLAGHGTSWPALRHAIPVSNERIVCVAQTSQLYSLALPSYCESAGARDGWSSQHQ